jgi:hypothetical protein
MKVAVTDSRRKPEKKEAALIWSLSAAFATVLTWKFHEGAIQHWWMPLVVSHVTAIMIIHAYFNNRLVGKSSKSGDQV